MKLAAENRQEFGSAGHDAAQLKTLFHRLNNQLAVALASAESMEFKADDEASRAQASETVAKILDAVHTVVEIHQQSTSAAV